MDRDSFPVAGTELENLRNAADLKLTLSLSDPAAHAELAAVVDGDAEKKAKIEEAYRALIVLVTQTTNDAIAQWCEKHALAPKIASAAKSRALYEQVGNTVAPAETERKFRELLLAKKRAELQRITEAIREEETATANRRVELEQQKKAAAGLEASLRSRGYTISITAKTGEEETV